MVLCPTKCVVHEAGVFRKESHLTLRIAAIGAVCVGFDEFADSEAIRGFVGRDRDVFAHKLASLLFRPPTTFPFFFLVPNLR